MAAQELTAKVIKDLSKATAARVITAKQISLPMAEREAFLTALVEKFQGATVDVEKPGMVAFITAPGVQGNVSVYPAAATVQHGFLELADGHPLVKSW
jgi:hypothetical protein